MIKKYLIANLNIEISFDGDEVLEKRLSPYEIDFSSDCDIKVGVTHASKDIEVKVNDLIKLSEIAYFYKTDKHETFFYHDPIISKIIAKIEFSKDYNDIKIDIYKLKENYNVEDNMLVYNVMGNVMNYVALMHHGFVFHSSAVCYDGYGIAFSAKSGTGKSTHTALWLKNYQDAFILNDDTPIITRGNDGNFYICGTPWAGTTGINQNFVVPLKAVVFLERAKENSIDRLTSGEAIKPFFEGIRTPVTDEMFSKCLDTLNELFLKVPIYKLKCNMDSSAAVVAKDFIFNTL